MAVKFNSCAPIGQPFDNPTLDALAARKSMQDVWWNLYHNFPLCDENQQLIDWARKQGDVRSTIHRYPVFAPLIKQFGPETKEEWEMLGVACILAATGKNVDTEELYERRKLTYG